MSGRQDARLSVIIPFYNETAFLRLAVNSVLTQGIADAEVIVVNDNPEEFDEATIRALGLPDTVRVVSHERNRGLSAARNTGIAAATGGLIGFLDADDYYVQDGLRLQLDEARASGADITHAQAYLSRQGSPLAAILKRDRDLFAKPERRGALTDAPQAQFIVSSWSSLYARDFLDSHGLRFDEEQPKFEDRLFVLDCVTRASSIAFLGEPVRVWRKRAGSISVTPTDPALRLLQLQLLEKCMARIRAEVATGTLAAQFERRELFNTLSRLIWDVDLLGWIADNPGDATAENHRNRIVTLLGDQSFGNAIFDDPMVAKIDRTGMATRKGRIRRVDFFAIHKALRDGDMAGAAAILDARRETRAPAIARRQPQAARLILHLGLHKTGTTWLQQHLNHHADTLRSRGILVPQTGRSDPGHGLRHGAYSGHQKLVSALRRGDTAPWNRLYDEVAASGAGTVVLSAENMLFPLAEDRDSRIADLAAALSGFASIQPLCLVRAPHRYLESFYKELVTSDQRAGSRSLDEFLVDQEANLTDLPALLGPVEEALGARVALGDFDALSQSGLWAGFCRLAGLPGDLPEIDAPRYASPGRSAIQLIRALHALVPSVTVRQDVIRSFLADAERDDRHSLVPPERRGETLARFRATSGAFAAERGYAPDYAGMETALAAEDWQPPSAIAPDDLERIVEAALRSPQLWVPTGDLGHTRLQRVMGNAPTRAAPPPQPAAKPKARRKPPGVTIRLRPWAARLLGRITGTRR